MDSIVQRIQVALHLLIRNINTDFQKLTDVQITGAQLFMLYFIDQEGRCKLNLLAEKMEVKPSAITVMIDRLVRAGYVHRTHDEEDRRAVLVEITPRGKEVLEKAGQEKNNILRTYLSKLEEKEVLLLAELLEKVVIEKE